MTDQQKAELDELIERVESDCTMAGTEPWRRARQRERLQSWVAAASAFTLGVVIVAITILLRHMILFSPAHR